MADNVIANAGTGGATFATDDIAGVMYPRTKVTFGPDGTATDVDVAAGAALPVQLRNTSGTEIGTAAAPLRINPTGTTAQPITDNSGSVTTDTPQLPAALGQAAMAGSTSVVLASDQSTVPVSLASVPSHAVTNAGTFAVQAAQSGTWTVQPGNTANTTAWKVDASSVAVPITDNSGSLTMDFSGQKTLDYDSGAGTDTVLGVGFLLPASGGAVAGGTATNPIQVSLANTAANGTAVKVDGSAVTQPVSGTVTITPSGTQTVAGAKTNNNAAPGATNIGALPAVANAAAPTQTEGNLVALRATLAGDLAVTLDSEAVVLGAGSATIGALTANQSVNVAQINGVAPLMGNGASGTGAQRVTIASDSTGQLISLGAAAHGASIAGAPVRMGLRAGTADFTAVTDGQTVDALATILGKQVVQPYAIPANTWSYAAAAGGLVSTTAVTVKTAGGAGVRNYITSIQVINSHATQSTEVIVNDGAAGTTLHRGWAQAAGGGYACKFDPPLRGTAATLVEIKEITATTTTGVLVSLQGYSAAE